MNGFEFEKPIIELESKVAELKRFSEDKGLDLSEEIDVLEDRLESLKKEIYGNLNPWQKVQIARHPKRFLTSDYISVITQDFIELHGDRMFGDDKALIGGLCTVEGKKIMLIGHQKGHDTKENIQRHFGCAHPEGYRKAMRLMRAAEKFKLPVVCFIDTPGAYPGVGAEERGQALAIAENLRDMMFLRTPILIVVIGEGGSGGALGIGVGDRILMLENSYYSVISPEGCASILWRDAAKAPMAAETLKLTAQDLLNLGIIDEIIPEPLGGAHKDSHLTAENLKETLLRNLDELSRKDIDILLEERYDKFRKIGEFEE